MKSPRFFNYVSLCVLLCGALRAQTEDPMKQAETRFVLNDAVDTGDTIDAPDVKKHSVENLETAKIAQENTDPPQAVDRDGDGISDAEDAVPDHAGMRVRASEEVTYRVVDLGILQEVGKPHGINDAGEVLLVDEKGVGRVWCEGKMSELGAGDFFSGILPDGSVYVGDVLVNENSVITDESMTIFSRWNYRVWRREGWGGVSVWKEAYQIETMVLGAVMNIESLGLVLPVYQDVQKLFLESCGLLNMDIYGGAAPTWEFPFLQSVSGVLKIFDGGKIYYHADAHISITSEWTRYDRDTGEMIPGHRNKQTGEVKLGRRGEQGKIDYWSWKARGIAKEVASTTKVENVEGGEQAGIGVVWMNEDGFVAGMAADEVSSWNVNPNGVRRVKPAEGEGVELPASMGDIKGLTRNQVGEGEGPYFRTTTGIVAYNHGNLQYKEIGSLFGTAFAGTPRTISNSLVMPVGARVWRNGQFHTTRELCGNPPQWSAVEAQVISPEQNLMAGFAIEAASRQMHAVFLVPVRAMDK